MAQLMIERIRDRRIANRRSITSAVVASLVVHLILGVIGGVWIVSRYIHRKPPQFEAPPPPRIKIPPQTRQHRMNLASHAALAAKPTFKPRLTSLRPAEFSLPEAPKVDIDALLVPDPSAMVQSLATSLSGASGLGAGGGFGLAGAGGKGLGKAIQFLGINAQGKRILLLFDVSGSVVNKANSSNTPLALIKDETMRLIQGLPADSRFGLIQFVRNYKMFREELVPATQANRELAEKWIQSEWRESGSLPRGGKGVISPDPNGLPPILRRAFEMKPDLIFLMSDGSFERGVKTSEKISEGEFSDLLKELNPGGIDRVPIHFVGFEMRDEDKRFWQRMARRSGGSLKEMK